MKKALVFYLYSNRNAGDMAICVGAIEWLKQQGYDIAMVSRFGDGEEEFISSRRYITEYFPDVAVYPGPFHFDREKSVGKQICSYAVGLIKAMMPWPDRRIAQLIEECDVVFFNGGNLLRAAGFVDYARLIALFYPIKWAKRKEKPVTCLPQSTAKTDYVGNKMLHHYLKMFDRIMIRESISLQEMMEKYPNFSFEKATDLAFLCKDSALAQKKLSRIWGKTDKKSYIALILRNTGIGDIGQISAELEEKLIDKMSSWVENHPEYCYVVVIQTKKDVAVSNKFLSLMQINNSIDISSIEVYDPLVAREIYKKAVITMSMRLHAAILSISAFTPVVGIFSEQWGLKNPGILGDYKMPCYMIEQQEQESIDDAVKKLKMTSKAHMQEKVLVLTNAMEVR